MYKEPLIDAAALQLAMDFTAAPSIQAPATTQGRCSDSSSDGSECAQFIRRHTHDLANCLAAIDLNVVLLERGIDIGAASECLSIICGQVECIAEMQMRLKLRFRVPQSTTVSLGSCVEQCRSRQRIGSAARNIEWLVDGADSAFHADIEAVSVITVEIADHWFVTVGGTIKAYAFESQVCFQMQRAGDSAATNCPSTMEIEVRDELNSVVKRYEGTLVGEAHETELTMIFPQFSESFKWRVESPEPARHQRIINSKSKQSNVTVELNNLLKDSHISKAADAFSPSTDDLTARSFGRRPAFYPEPRRA